MTNSHVSVTAGPDWFPHLNISFKAKWLHSGYLLCLHFHHKIRLLYIGQYWVT